MGGGPSSGTADLGSRVRVEEAGLALRLGSRWVAGSGGGIKKLGLAFTLCLLRIFLCVGGLASRLHSDWSFSWLIIAGEQIYLFIVGSFSLSLSLSLFLLLIKISSHGGGEK